MTESPRTALILGGARSGKSAFGQRLAAQLGEPVLFVATAVAEDDEMAARIATHRAERPSAWQTVEARRWIGRAIAEQGAGIGTILVDCLTLLVSNCAMDCFEPAEPTGDEADARVNPGRLQALVDAEVDELLAAARAASANLVVVSGEVGMGIVPAYPLGRAFRDALGRANQTMAAASDAVYLMVAGIPVDVRRIEARAPW